MNNVESVRAFFFAPESPRPVALMRIGLGLVLLVYFAARWPFAVELYSQAGQPMPVFPDTAWEPPAPRADVAVAMHSALLFALVSVTIGWRTRLSLAVALILSAWLGLLDAPGTFKKYSVIGLHLMLLLAASHCGSIWSADRWLSPDRRRFVQLGAAWPRRLMQVLVCSIYWSAAMTKLRLPDFANGDLLMFSLLDDQWGSGGWGLWLATQPRLLTLLSLATVFFEIAFPLLVWTRLRPAMIAAAIAFHVSVGTALYLSIFSPVMLVAVLSFFTEHDLSRMTRRVRPLVQRRRFRMPHRPIVDSRADEVCDSLGTPFERGDETAGDDPHAPESSELSDSFTHVSAAWVRWASKGSPWSPILYAGIGGLAIVLGQAAQTQMTRSGDLRDPGAVSWVALDARKVERMLAAQLPVYEDYFHRIELGSRVSNTHAFGERDRFAPGMVAYIVARLNQNHPPMRLEGLLVAPDGQEVGRFEHDLESSHSHAVNGFRLTENLPHGRYRIVLQADGHQVAQKTFVLSESAGLFGTR